jgi:hypothetical protein
MPMTVQKADGLATKLHIFKGLDDEDPLCGAEHNMWGCPIIGSRLTWDDFDPECCCDPCWEAHTGIPNPSKAHVG